MEIDLLFMAINPADWRAISEAGEIETGRDNDKNYIRLFQGAQAEKIINHYYGDEDSLLLLVLDPLRIQMPIKHIKEDNLSIVAIQGAISVDTIIDKIRLEKGDNGKFSVLVKHFD